MRGPETAGAPRVRSDAMRTALVALILFAASPALRAQALAAWGTVASDYVERGVALGGGGPVLQLGAEAAWDSGVVAGAVGTTIERLWPRNGGRASGEVDAYLGWDFACGGRCRARALVTRYLYPGRGDANWTEWSVSVAPHPRFGFALSRSSRVYGVHLDGEALEAWYDHPLGETVTLGVALGRIRTDVYDYGFGRFGATWRRGRAAFDVSYHVADDDFRRNGLTDDLRHVVASASWAF